MSDEIITSLENAVLRITLNAPDDGNVLTDGAAAELTSIIEGAADHARLIVLSGAGDDFCIGRSRAGRFPAASSEALDRRRQTEVIFDCYGVFRRTPLPVIGVVKGRAFGFGCSLAALCDITLASEAATFQIPEMGHNTLPTMVMSSLYDRVPAKALKYLVYTTAIITAERALTYGIVSEVVPAADLEAVVEKATQTLLGMPDPALLGVKEYLATAPHMDTRGAVDFARNLHATINSSGKMKK